jgi:asparagine synthase (glutamine-hydrolysing)
MCGIVGIFLSDTTNVPSESLLSDMIQVIKHRGPDAQKIWAAPGVGFAHARLSIIDLHASADQPMRDPETGNCLIFNGEIYNYIELKQRLVLCGHVFHTQSDTEVILKAYAEWGVDCLKYFNGMWAFALYDAKLKTLFAARDRIGIKPFVYGITKKNEFVFASEAKAIIRFFPEFKEINEAFRTLFIEKGFFASYKETFLKNIFNLMPGHYFLIKHGEEPKQKRYWEWVPRANATSISDKDAVERFRALLVDSIKLRFRSDVPVGACLSGGLDSGTIVGLASAMFDKPIHTFSCVFPNAPEFDESQYIKASVSKFNAIAKYKEPTHDDFIELIQASVYEQDGPTGGPSVLSQRAVMELAGANVKVVLDGQGADEILGGYHSYFHCKISTLARSVYQNPSLKNLTNYYRTLYAIKKRTSITSQNLLKHFKRPMAPSHFHTSFTSSNQLSYMTPFKNDDLNTLLLEHVFTNLTDLLHYEDRNSMAFSVESRLPFLDYRLIEYAFTLSHEYKIRGDTTKWLLHHVAKDILPEKVLKRRDKMGFSTPAHKWFLAGNNLRYFSRFLEDNNPIFSQLSQSMQLYMRDSFRLLSNSKDAEVTPSSAGDVNALWRLFTANIWTESV